MKTMVKNIDADDFLEFYSAQEKIITSTLLIITIDIAMITGHLENYYNSYNHDSHDDHDQRARVSDSGAYMCQPSVGGPAGAMVHVIRGGSILIDLIPVLILIVMIVMRHQFVY